MIFFTLSIRLLLIPRRRPISSIEGTGLAITNLDWRFTVFSEQVAHANQ